jgi:Cu/Ag efflux protein CusF
MNCAILRQNVGGRRAAHPRQAPKCPEMSRKAPWMTMKRIWPLAVAALCGLQPAFVAAAPATPSAAAGVFTRATVRGIFEEDGGKRVYIRLKLVPQGKIPFSTLTFRVPDRSLVAGIADGASVAFRAERIGGENTLVAIRPAPPCERFQPCD